MTLFGIQGENGGSNMKRIVHFKKNPLVLVQLLIACLILLISCGAQNKGSASHGPSPNETQVSSPSTSTLPTPIHTSIPPTNTPPPTPIPTSIPPTNTSSTTSPPSLCPIIPSSLTFTTIVGQDPPAQQVTIANCGGPGNWTASTSTNDGAHWLSSSPSKGWLDSGASQKVSIAVSSV